MTAKQVWPEVVRDMLQRNETGRDKYNRYLQTDCPDNMLQHAYEEALDLTAYLKTLIMKETQRQNDFYENSKQLQLSPLVKSPAQEIEEIFAKLHKDTQ